MVSNNEVNNRKKRTTNLVASIMTKGLKHITKRVVYHYHGINTCNIINHDINIAKELKEKCGILIEDNILIMNLVLACISGGAPLTIVHLLWVNLTMNTLCFSISN